MAGHVNKDDTEKIYIYAYFAYTKIEIKVKAVSEVFEKN